MDGHWYSMWGEATYVTWFGVRHNWTPDVVRSQRIGDLDRLVDVVLEAEKRNKS